MSLLAPQSNLFQPLPTGSHQFADKVSPVEACCRRAWFILHRRRAGKIAHLPESVREQINLMLSDGLPYAAIIARLGPAGKGLNKDNLSRWKKNGHQDWVKEHQRRADVRTKLQFALDIVRENENSKIHEASQQMAALQVCELLTDFDPAALKQTLQDDPSGYVRLLNALPKLSKGGLACERLRVELAERKAKLEKEKIPRRQRGISAKALRLAEAKLNLM